MTRTLENCSLITKMDVIPYQENGKCFGFGKRDYDDEPCEICKKCKLNVYYDGGKVVDGND